MKWNGMEKRPSDELAKAKRKMEIIIGTGFMPTIFFFFHFHFLFLYFIVYNRLISYSQTILVLRFFERVRVCMCEPEHIEWEHTA